MKKRLTTKAILCTAVIAGLLCQPPCGRAPQSAADNACLAPYAAASDRIDLDARLLPYAGSAAVLQESAAGDEARRENLSPLARKLAALEAAQKTADTALPDAVAAAEKMMDFSELFRAAGQGADILYPFEQKLQGLLSSASMDLEIKKRQGVINKEEYESSMGALKKVRPLVRKLGDFVLSGVDAKRQAEAGRELIKTLEQQYKMHEKELLAAYYEYMLMSTDRKAQLTSASRPDMAAMAKNMHFVCFYNKLVLNAYARLNEIAPQQANERDALRVRVRGLMKRLALNPVLDGEGRKILAELEEIVFDLRPWRLFTEREQINWSKSKILFLDAAAELLELAALPKTHLEDDLEDRFFRRLFTYNPVRESESATGMTGRAA